MQRRLATHIFPFAVGLLALGIAVIELAPQATGQTGDGWTTLLDDKTMGDWNKVGESRRRGGRRQEDQSGPSLSRQQGPL